MSEIAHVNDVRAAVQKVFKGLENDPENFDPITAAADFPPHVRQEGERWAVVVYELAKFILRIAGPSAPPQEQRGARQQGQGKQAPASPAEEPVPYPDENEPEPQRQDDVQDLRRQLDALRQQLQGQQGQPAGNRQ